jgi:hypothetical protein
MGENYVLGNRDDCNQFTPYLLDPRMFEENPVVMMALGTMHAVALVKESPEAAMPELDSTKFAATVQAMPLPVSPTPVKKMNGDHLDDVKSQKSQESKKRSRQESVEAHSQKSEISSAVKRLKIQETTPLEPVLEEK